MNSISRLESLKNADWNSKILSSDGEIIRSEDTEQLQKIAASSWDAKAQIADGKLVRNSGFFGFAKSIAVPLFGYRTITFDPSKTYNSIQLMITKLAEETESGMSDIQKYKLAKHAISNYHKYLERLERKNEKRDLSYVRFHNFNLEEMLGEKIMESYKSLKNQNKAIQFESLINSGGEESEVGNETENKEKSQGSSGHVIATPSVSLVQMPQVQAAPVQAPAPQVVVSAPIQAQAPQAVVAIVRTVYMTTRQGTVYNNPRVLEGNYHRSIRKYHDPYSRIH